MLTAQPFYKDYKDLCGKCNFKSINLKLDKKEFSLIEASAFFQSDQSAGSTFDDFIINSIMYRIFFSEEKAYVF